MAIRRSTDVSPPQPTTLRTAVPSRPVTAPSAPQRPGARGTTPPSTPQTGFETNGRGGATTGTTPALAPQGRLAELRSLMLGHTDRAAEARVLRLLKEAPAAELNQLIGAVSTKELHELFSDMDDRLVGPDNKTGLLNLLSSERVAELEVPSRTKVVQALQRGGTDRLEEKAIASIFLATTGVDLTALKNGIDGGGDYRDLQQLVFHDLDSKQLRGQLLEHFKSAAAPKSARVKVLSDIDDTFYVNWKDDRYPKKTVYPGVRALYAELDRGAGHAPDPSGDLMFLSARPYDRVGVSENRSRETLEKNGVTQCTVLSGDFAHLIGNDSIAEKKFDNWQQVNQLYPEYGSVFIGDSGQGDAIFGAKAAATQGGDMRSVFIHNVTHLDDADKADFARKNVFVFDTYVGAAAEAYRRGLIDKGGLERVMDAAVKDFKGLTFASPEQHAARKAELDADLAAARAVL